MNRIRIGHPEYGIITWIVGQIPLLLILFFNPPFIVTLLIFASITISVFGVTWLPHIISKNQLRPAIDKCKPGETTWCRVSKDRIIVPQFVTKGPYGQTKGVVYREKADVIDDGAFPIRWLNGNPCILMYDLMNTSIDLNKSVARKIMKKNFDIRSGIEAYEKCKKEKATVVSLDD